MGNEAQGAIDLGFKKEKKFLDDKVDSLISVNSASSAIQESIRMNRPFPAGVIRLAEISTGLSGDSGDLQFGGASGPVVSFKGSAKGNGNLGV